MPDARSVERPTAVVDAVHLLRLIRVAHEAHHWRTLFLVAFLGNVVQCVVTNWW